MSKDDPQTLREVAQAASDRHEGARGRALGRAAEAAGLTLSYTTVDKILEGTYKSRPKSATLDALAHLSGFTREQVYAAAGEPMPLKPLRDELPPDADHLTGAQRRVVLDAIRLFAQQNLHAFALEQRLKEGGSDGGIPDAQKIAGDGGVGASVTHLPTSSPTDGEADEDGFVENAARPGDDGGDPPQGTSTTH